MRRGLEWDCRIRRRWGFLHRCSHSPGVASPSPWQRRWSDHSSPSHLGPPPWQRHKQRERLRKGVGTDWMDWFTQGWITAKYTGKHRFLCLHPVKMEDTQRLHLIEHNKQRRPGLVYRLKVRKFFKKCSSKSKIGRRFFMRMRLWRLCLYSLLLCLLSQWGHPWLLPKEETGPPMARVLLGESCGDT